MPKLFDEFNYGTLVPQKPIKQPRKPRRAAPQRIVNPDGANYGGACQGCGKELEWWLNYKLCDRCLTTIPPYVSFIGRV